MLVVLLILAALAACLVLGGYLVYRFAIVRRPPLPPPDPAAAPNAVRRRYAEGFGAQMDWLRAWGWQAVSITGHRGGRLAGYLFRAKSQTARTVLAVHGYRNEGLREYLYFAPMYLEQLGMNLLVVDDCAHGASEGRHIGFGWFDRLDCVSWAEWLVDTFGPDSEILLQGVSMGAATVLMATGEAALPKQVRWTVADCGYTGIKAQIRHVMKADFHVPAFPLYHLASLFCRLLAGYWFAEGDTLRQVGRAAIPILFIHGAQDGFVPTAMAHQLYAACPTPKALRIVPGAAHAESYLTDPDGYLEAVRGLLQGLPRA